MPRRSAASTAGTYSPDICCAMLPLAATGKRKFGPPGAPTTQLKPQGTPFGPFKFEFFYMLGNIVPSDQKLIKFFFFGAKKLRFFQTAKKDF